MDRFSLFVPNFLPSKEYFTPEKNQACPGCGLALAVRQIYKALENDIEKAAWETGSNGSSLLQLKRGKAEIMICLDNEASGGITEAVRKSDPALAVAEGVSYMATASPSYPFDLNEKLKKALDTAGKTYLHILCPCPVGWQFDPELTVKIGRFAVESRVFPLYEVEGGSYRQTVMIPKPRLLADYLKLQKRFSDLREEQVEEAATQVENTYKKLI